jgi:sugar transferase (PEP-CTERM/EpsH1 system associated)
MRKIRVVHVLHSFGTGGLEKGVATTIKHASDTFEHIIVCLSTSGESSRLVPAGTSIYELQKPPGNSFFFLLKLTKALRGLDPDVVHTRNWGGMDGIIAARLAGIKAVLQGEHGWEINDPDGVSFRRVRVRKLLSTWVHEFTCVSKDIESWLKETVKVRCPVTQIYNGVDVELYHPASGRSGVREELNIADDIKVIGTVGRLDPIKDYPVLFQAFSVLKRKHSNLRLLVVGDGPERKHLANIAPLGVHLVGQRMDVAEMLRAMDIFVLTSLNEGISNTILEAMSTGVPTVATAVGGTPELVQDGVTGTLIPPRSPSKLALALSVYLEQENVRRMHGNAARRRVVENFSIDAMVKSYETVYRRAVAVR